MLAAAYEHIIDEGVDIPADARRKLADLIRSNPFDPFARDRRDAIDAIDQETEYLRTKLLEQSVQANDLFKVAHLMAREEHQNRKPA